MWAVNKFVTNQIAGAGFPPLSSCDGRQNGQNCCWNAGDAAKNGMPQCKK